MTTVFIWTGFLCAMLIILILTFYAIVYVVDLTIRRTKLINIACKAMIDFYTSFPNKRKDFRYVITLYDYEKRRFIDSTQLNTFGENSEEHQKYWDEMKRKHARVRE